MTEEIEPQEMFKKRKEIGDHFKKKREELNKYKLEGLSGAFAKGRLLSIIASHEREALEEAEDNHWQNVEGILSKCDKEIDNELEPFISRLDIGGLKKE